MEIIAEYESDIDAVVHSVMDIHLLIRLLGEEGIRAHQLLTNTGLVLEDIENQETLISFRQKLAIFKNVIELSNDPAIGLTAGSLAKFGDFGFFGYAVFSSATLGEAIELGFKYLKIAGPVLKKSVTVEGTTGIFKGFNVLALEELLPFCTEYWFSSINALCSEIIGGPFPSISIKVPYARPDYADVYEQIFHCPIEFDADTIEWTFDASYLGNKIPTANPLTVQMCIKSCDEFLETVSQPGDLAQQVNARILESAGSFPSIEIIAGELNMSSRSLRRHLKELGTSYQQILDQTKKQLAIQFLQNTKLTVEEIASRTGYTEASNFRHAFRKWTGKTPQEIRSNVS